MSKRSAVPQRDAQPLAPPPGARAQRRRGTGLTLKGRALMLLARREHSRAELRRKLLPMAQADAGDDAAAGEARLDALLEWLEAHNYLSQERFVEARLHSRAARYGNRRIEQELAQHGVELDRDARAQLRDSELARAQQVWQRKYGRPPADTAERLRQMRFLAGRGFSAEVVRGVVPRVASPK